MVGLIRLKGDTVLLVVNQGDPRKQVFVHLPLATVDYTVMNAYLFSMNFESVSVAPRYQEISVMKRQGLTTSFFPRLYNMVSP